APYDTPPILDSLLRERSVVVPPRRGDCKHKTHERQTFFIIARDPSRFAPDSARGGGGLRRERLDGRVRRSLVVRQRFGKPRAELLLARAVARVVERNWSGAPLPARCSMRCQNATAPRGS